MRIVSIIIGLVLALGLAAGAYVLRDTSPGIDTAGHFDPSAATEDRKLELVEGGFAADRAEWIAQRESEQGEPSQSVVVDVMRDGVLMQVVLPRGPIGVVTNRRFGR